MKKLANLFRKRDADHRPIILHDVPHLRQCWTWDCGVTCVLMLLDPEAQRQALADLPRICAEEGFGQSTWTIDLCYLLKRFGIQHRMFTTNLGVNEAHRDLKYYSQIIDKDRSRVSERFASSGENGVSVSRGRLPPLALAAHLAPPPAPSPALPGNVLALATDQVPPLSISPLSPRTPAPGEGGPAVVLVDAARLQCERCGRNSLTEKLRRWFGGSYSGHYVLVVGVDRGKNRFYYRDPARPACPGPRPTLKRHLRKQGLRSKVLQNEQQPPSSKNDQGIQGKKSSCADEVQVPCVVAAGRLAAAAAAPGTDHDVILIDKSYRRMR